MKNGEGKMDIPTAITQRRTREGVRNGSEEMEGHHGTRTVNTEEKKGE